MKNTLFRRLISLVTIATLAAPCVASAAEVDQVDQDMISTENSTESVSDDLYIDLEVASGEQEEVTDDIMIEVNDGGLSEVSGESSDSSAEVSTELVAEDKVITYTATDDLADTDELLYEYLGSDIASDEMELFSVTAGQKLTGYDKVLYDAYLASIKQVAAGKQTSTVFSVVIEDEWTPQELGVTNIKSQEALNKALDQITDISTSNVIKALLSDCPFDLYWYAKTQATSTRFSYSWAYVNGNLHIIETVKTSFPVSSDFAGSAAYTVSTSKLSAVNTAKANIQKVIDSQKTADDYQKLAGYKQSICDMVSYNNEAAAKGSAYGSDNAWQLIWVFDGNPNTNVVCEGYTKAFQYLCQLSDFSTDVSCITVTGTMAYNGSENHAWNVVRMADNANYLVDITNCDTGTIGAPDKLFMAGASGSLSNGYTVSANGKSVKYTYDTQTKAAYDPNYLTVAAKGYKNVELVAPVLTSVSGENTGVRVKWNAVSGAEKYRVFYKLDNGSWTKAGDTTSTNYLVTGLSNNTHYTFTVRCIDAKGNFESGYDSKGLGYTRLVTPSINSAANATTGILAKWSSVSGAAKYRVYYKVQGGSWSKYADVVGTSITIPEGKLSSGKQYYVTVKAVAKDGSTSGYDANGKSTYWVPSPKLSSAANTKSGVQVKWNAVSGATKYRVYYKVKGGSWVQYSDVKTTNITIPSSKLVSGKTYYFTVRALNAAGKISSYDGTGKVCTWLTQPVLSSAKKVSSGITVKWGSVKGASKYRVYYKVKGGSWTKYKDVSGTSVTVAKAKFTKSKTYYFTIRALSADGTLSSYDTTGKYCKW